MGGKSRASDEPTRAYGLDSCLQFGVVTMKKKVKKAKAEAPVACVVERVRYKSCLPPSPERVITFYVYNLPPFQMRDPEPARDRHPR